MVEGVRRPEPDRAVVHRFRDQRLHLTELVRGGFGPFGRRLAHDRGADDGMTGEHRDVRAWGDARSAAMYSPNVSKSQRTPVRRASRSMPSTTDRLRRMRSRDVRRRGSDPETAVAHHRRRHPERGRGRESPVPGDLRVVVGMQIDEARCEGEPARVDLALRVPADLSDGADAPVADRDVPLDRFVAESVDDGRTANDELIHEVLSRAQFSSPRGYPRAMEV